mmetsp:Transcript_51363/g.120685  ORF Transcript_51363/g.120685 Transcript_51363/m.120685 type:complete len:153 (-) Transcript_51363:59-517(-)
MGGVVTAIRGRTVHVDILSENQLLHLREEFKRYDDDNKDLLTFPQFARLLERRIHSTRNKVEEASSPNTQDMASTSPRTHESYSLPVLPRVKSKQHIQDRNVAHLQAELAFQAADKNGDKVLTFEEFADWNRELIKSAKSKLKKGWLDSDEV